MALIELRNVEKHFRMGEVDVAALDGVSLVIEEGEFVAIVGQSGSGKSTLLNVLGCLDKPTLGQFFIDGKDASRLEPDQLALLRRARFGFIFQRYHLLSQLDAKDNAALPALYAGVGRKARHERANQLLKRLGLGERTNHKPSELSGGQQQRVSIARALMNGGRIILADEPTGALDSGSGAELLRLLGELNAEGHTVVLVTHDAAVAAHAHRVIEMKDGKVLKDIATKAPRARGTPSERAGFREQEQQGQRWAAQWREAVHTAWLALKSNRLRTGLSMLGISIGIASVVSIVALTSAARRSIETDVGALLSGRIPVFSGNPNLPPGAVPQRFKPSEIDSLRSLPGVSRITLNREAMLLARYGARDAGVTVLGAEAATLRARKLKVTEGRYFAAYDYENNSQAAVLDQKARESLFRKGEPVIGRMILVNPTGLSKSAPQADADRAAMVSTDSESATSTGIALPMVVVGVVDSDGVSLASGFENARVLVPESTFQRKLDTRTDVDSFTVLLAMDISPAQVREQIVHRLRAMHGVEDFTALNSDEEFRKFQNITSAMAALFAGVAAISLAVGGVGVMNIMLVSVSERTREIGIRMAVGARQADVRLQFLIESVVLCCLGGSAGVILSWLGAQAINAAQTQLSVHVTGGAVGVAFVVSSVVGVVFGTVPARRAAALSPVIALQRD